MDDDDSEYETDDEGPEESDYEDTEELEENSSLGKGGQPSFKLSHLYMKWLVNVLKSPLNQAFKDWFASMCQNFFAHPPLDAISFGSTLKASTIIAFCLAQNCPITFLREVFTGACSVSEELQPYCRVRYPSAALLALSNNVYVRCSHFYRERTISMVFTL